MPIARALIEKEEIEKLRLEKATLLTDIEVLRKEHVALAESFDDLVKRSGFSPEEYRNAEKGHRERMEKLESDIIAKQIIFDRLSGDIELMGKTIGLDVIRRDGLEKEVREFEAAEARIKKSILQKTIEFNAISTKAEKKRVEADKEAKKLDTKLSEAQSELRNVRKETANRKEQIMQEEKILEIKRQDLEIYESRMKKKYPGENFTFTS